MQVVEERDYVTNDKPSGYRSYHMVISYPVQMATGEKKILAEIQIRTLAMNFWATIEHSLSYKYPKAFPKEINDRLKRAAEAAFMLDKEMSAIREEIQDAQVMFNYSRGKQSTGAGGESQTDNDTDTGEKDDHDDDENRDI
jgi:putative GTP pyrophosphokinase